MHLHPDRLLYYVLFWAFVFGLLFGLPWLHRHLPAREWDGVFIGPRSKRFLRRAANWLIALYLFCGFLVGAFVALTADLPNKK